MSKSFRKYCWALRTFLRKPWFGYIGMMTYMGKPSLLHQTKNIYISNKVRIQPGARLETHGDGLIHIEENVSIGQNLHCSAANNLMIGKGTTISGNVLITDMDHEYQKIDVPIMEQDIIKNETIIGENCFIGFGAAILAGTKLGKQCIVGTNAVVRGEFPDYSVIVGAPARIVKKYNIDTKRWEKVDNK